MLHQENLLERTQNQGDLCPASLILLEWLKAWKIQDPQQRLAACCRCKLATIQWQQQNNRCEVVK